MSGQIAIIGLGQIGASAGMALKRAGSSLRRVGFDRDSGVRAGAEAVGAVDQVVNRIPDAVREADIVLLALPLGNMAEVIRGMIPYLKESAVVMDTAPIKASLMRTLQDSLPDGRYYAGLVPAVNSAALADHDTGLKAARPDLFVRTAMVVDLPRGVPAEVEQLAVNFVKLLGAKPLLADPGESDGMMAAAHILPQLAAGALLDATVDQPGWGDARKVAGRPFVGVTGGLAYFDDPASLKAAALGNPAAVVHALDSLIGSLRGLRDSIERGDEQAVGEALNAAFESRERWLNERGAADWLGEGGEAPELPNLGEQMMQMFFGNRLMDRAKRLREESKKRK